MLTHEQIKELAALASALQKVTDREEKAMFNLQQRYAIERGELKAAASAEVLALHQINIGADADVAAYRLAQTDAAETTSETTEESPPRRGRPRA